MAPLNAFSLGVSKAKRGYRWGYKFTFDFVKSNAYPGFKLSLDRFHRRFLRR